MTKRKKGIKLSQPVADLLQYADEKKQATDMVKYLMGMGYKKQDLDGMTMEELQREHKYAKRMLEGVEKLRDAFLNELTPIVMKQSPAAVFVFLMEAINAYIVNAIPEGMPRPSTEEMIAAYPDLYRCSMAELLEDAVKDMVEEEKED